MIEQFETENSNSSSVIGRAALVGGTAYAGYSTFSDMKSNRPANPNNANLRQTIGRLRNIRGQTGGVSDTTTGPSFTSLLGNTREMRKQQQLAYKQGLTPRMLSNMGFKSKGALASQITDFKTKLNKSGFTGVAVEYKMIGNHVGEIRIKGRYGGRNNYFKLNPVGADGTVLIGDNLQNKYIGRGILDPASLAGDLTKGNLKVVDSDVALLSKYSSEIDNIRRGTVNPHDLYKKMQNSILFEENNHGLSGVNGGVAQLRREQVVIDPWGDLSGEGKASVMRSITARQGWGAGSAAQYAKGILNSPNSILNTMTPGAGISPTAYQLLRPSSFDGAVKPAVDWFNGAEVGAGEFSYAYVKDKKLLDATMKHMGYGVGEVADEEMLMNKTRNFKVKNEIYNAKVDLDGLSTKSSMGLFQKVTDRLGLGSTQELGKVLASPGGISSLGPEALGKLDFDINEDYRKLLDRKSDILRKSNEIKNVKGLSQEGRKIARANLTDELRETRRAIKEYEAFGIAKDMAHKSKLPAKDLENRIMNMSIDSNNQLSIAMQSHYRFGVGSKSFGAAKSTVKAEVDTAAVLAQMEFFKASGRFGSMDEIKDLIPDFADVDFIGMESPVKTAAGGMEARRMPNAISGYISTAIAEGRTDELAALGVTKDGDNFTLAEKDPRKLIEKIKELNPDKQLDDVFAGTQRGMADVRISRAIMSSDVHAAQAGIGGSGTITERGMFYLEAMGLNKVTDDIYNRAMREGDIFDQIKTLTDAQGAKATVGVDALIGSGDLNPTGGSSLFHANLDERARVVERLGGKGTLTVDLGREIDGIKSVNIFSQNSMAPYVGTQIGTDGGLTSLDRATRDLLQGAATGSGVSEEAMAVRAARYKEEMAKVQESLAAAIGKAKIKSSMYGQAVSSLPGMDEAGLKLGQQMGLGDQIAPMVAMSKEDIRMKFGDEAVQRAMRGDLYGLVSREPIEGSHSLIPSQIRVAEEVSGGKLSDALGDMSGRVFVGNSPMMRKSLMVDFDKDTLNVIALMGKDGSDQIKSFMGLNGQQSEIGKEYYKSLQRMPFLDPKGGKSPVDALSTIDSELSGILSAQKQLEKGSIGIFSNEFKKIHAGLREQLSQGGNAASYFKGEDFAHVFVENIIKSKHQSKEALLAGEAMETLDLLGAKGKYARATLDERALRMQEIFDQLSFASTKEAATVRELGTMALASDKSMVAEGLSDLVGQFDGPDTLRAKAFAEVSDIGNIKNILQAHSTGGSILSQGDYMWNAVTDGGKQASMMGSKFDDAVATAKSFLSQAGPKMFKYAIAPAAIIGFASSIFSQPNVLRKSSAAHDVSDPTPETIDAGKTIFAIPESKVDNIQIKGRANANTNFGSLQAMGASSGGNYSANIQDMRSKPDKYRIQELIDKGY